MLLSALYRRPRSGPATARARAALLLLVLAALGCGERRDGAANSQAVARPASPIRDSIRARRNAELRRRPDTLGARADSARILGDPAAPLWVIVVSDFQCAECRTLAVEQLPAVRREFVDAGRARLAFINFPQDRHFNARFAALAALCAGTSGREHFWAVHDLIFARQSDWERMPDPRPYLNSLAASAGVPAAAQNDCMERDRMLLRLSSDIERGFEMGVTQVPAVFVGDRRLEPRDLRDGGLARAIRRALTP